MLNKVILVGNVGADPELINKDTNRARCTFTLATWELKRNDEGKIERIPSWHSVVAFGRTADSGSANLKKGKQVLVEGKLQSNRWEDKNGIKHSAYEIVANAIYPLGKKEGRGQIDSPQNDSIQAAA